MTTPKIDIQVPPNVSVVAFTGRARAGKDTAAKYMNRKVAEYNAQCEPGDEVAFVAEAYAGPLKSMIAMLLDFYGKGAILEHDTLAPYIDGDLKEEVIPEIGKSPREMLQTLGTEWGRDLVNENLWTNCMASRINMYHNVQEMGYKHLFIAITDARFDNEAEQLHAARIPLISISAEKRLAGQKMKHKSEAGLRRFDSVVLNDTTIEEYERRLELVLQHKLPTWIPVGSVQPIPE